MIGVCIPAHNEEERIQACLDSVIEAALCPGLRGEPVVVAVVLDACSDRSLDIVQATIARHPACAAYGVEHASLSLFNVGRARAEACRIALSRGARWLAFTDADSTVSPHWLADQLSLGCDVVCGTVSVRPGDWASHGPFAEAARLGFAAGYQDRDGHRHIHGANLGVRADLYHASGGFAPMACSEDEHLVRSLERLGARIAWSAKPRVETSGRPRSRVAGGFASALSAGIGGAGEAGCEPAL